MKDLNYIKSLKQIFILVILFLAQTVAAQNIKKIFSNAEKQMLVMFTEIERAKANIELDIDNELVSPRSLSDTGDLQLVPSKDWTSGFFPGNLWYLFEYTQNENWLEQAELFTSKIEKEKFNSKTHDMGFKIYNSFGNGFRLTKDSNYKKIILEAAETLSTRFNPIVGCIRSWDHNKDKWVFPVIIDNMLNLELLFEATRISGDSLYYNIAVSHANTTLKNHFRPDYSTYHVIDYEPLTGKVVNKNTHQGYSDESAWARGQAWALYGYTMCYRETKNIVYLKQAEQVAKFIFNNPNLPKDLIPYWDFNAPNIPNEPRDVSAATVIASVLIELSTYSDRGAFYLKKAKKILKYISKKYTSPIGENKGFILLHSTGSKPHNSEIDVPIIYADYYYLESLLRLKNLNSKTP